MKKNQNKKAVHVRVEPLKYVGYKYGYTYPKCKSYFIDYNLSDEITRKRCCHCGQELIFQHTKNDETNQWTT
jgi:hypothetical protein